MDEALLFPLMSIAGLLVISAFFSCAETGITSVTRAKIHKLKMEGNRRAIILSKLREDKERLIGAILLGNNVVNIAASAIATDLAIRYFMEGGVAYATAIMTILVLIFGELLPKTYAVRHAEKVALSVAPAFVIITKIFAPVTLAVQAVVSRLINLFSSPPEDDMSSVEVLRGAVEMYHEEGGVPKQEKNMLSGIFDLEDTEVGEIMIHRSDIYAINIGDSMSSIVKALADSEHSRVPLWQNTPDNIVGVIHSKDVFKAVQNYKGDINKLDITPFIRQPWFVPETTTLKNQLNAFRKRHAHFALVVDEFGGLTGLITLEDIIEEVVGEIEDEHDKPNQRRIRRLKDGSFNVDGDLTVRELNRELDWHLSDKDATTIAGMVLHEAQRIPEEGDLFDAGDYMFKVLKKRGNQLTRIKVRRLKKTPKSVEKQQEMKENSAKQKKKLEKDGPRILQKIAPEDKNGSRK